MTAPAPCGFDTVAAVARGATSVTAVVEGALQQVRSADDIIQAFRVIDEAAVLARGKELDEQTPGPLTGLLVGVKDVIDTADLPTGYGSPLFADYQPSADAEAVETLRRAGAVIVGKTETAEFAMFHPTRTRNPRDTSRTPGGSSSGSAAAVAAGMVHVALGTQTGGSVIRPGSYCGVYGFKPTRGWTSTRGIWKLAESLDTLGLFSRSVRDLRLVHDVLRQQPRSVPPRRAGPPSAVVLPARDWGATEPVVDEALDRVADALSAAGWNVSAMQMPPAWRQLPEQHAVVMAAEVARNLRARLGSRVDAISASAFQIVDAGDRTFAPDYLAALDARDDALAALRPLALTADLLLMPSALGVAPVGLEFTGDPVMCRPWSLLGLPAANVPVHTSNGLPVGVQAVGLTGGDDAFLHHLASVEASLTQQEDAR
jgi:Asp-tRNA(Asn)/Glu-tRNA(Gln) amidotransferase A subunit family amidase